MRIWVPGGNGMLAAALKRRAPRLGVEVVGTDRGVDLTDPARAWAFAGDGRFDAILNCAAWTKVDLAETEEDQAFLDNAVVPGVLAGVAARLSIPLVHVSTDYVFPGDADRPYREDDPTGPLSAYGRTKLEGERRALGGGGHVAVVRTSWLFGPQGKSFVTTMLRLMAEREVLRVVVDQVGRPTYTLDLADAMLRLAGAGGAERPPPGVYHFANADQTTWHAFAMAIRDGAQARGLPVKATSIEAVPTSEYPTPAKRPSWSVLDTAKIEAATGVAPRSWRAGLDELLDELAAG